MTVPAAIGEIRGLPAHVLLVHGVVVLVPLAAGLLVLAAWWPAARVRLGPFLPLLSAGCLVLVPITTQAGQWLRKRVVQGNPLIKAHADLGKQLLPWVVALLLLSLAVWLRGRRLDSAELVTHRHAAGGPGTRGSAGSVATRAAGRPALLTVVVAVLATAVAAGAVLQTVRIGESGSKAVWQGVVSAR